MTEVHGNQLDPGEESERVTVRIPPGLLEDFESAIERGHYKSLSEAIRESMRETIRDRREWR